MSWKRVLGTGGFSIFAIGAAGFFWIWSAPCAFGGCAPLDDLAAFQAEGSELFDIHGEPFARLATVNRRIVSIDSLPTYVPAAFVAIEDRRFYQHAGVDIWRTAGALINNIRSGRVEEGGSTITQQLARNLFPEWLPYTERNLRRKILEARVARQIERTFTKAKILELYLNHIYLGSGAYGVEAAAWTYFGKPASELTLSEAATLAGVPRAPSRVNPKEDLLRSSLRRDLVLDAMVEANYITPAEAAAGKTETLTVTDGGVPQDGTPASYFVEQVRRELENRIGSRFYTDGLKVYTTFDPAVQGAAERELERQLDAIESGRFGPYRHPSYSPGATPGDGRTAYLQGAVVVMEARTGAVRALVGGRDFQDSRFNRATQALRQPGSAFKPFIYAVALQRYGSPAHLVEDQPLRVVLSDGRTWEPRNYSERYDGTITLREALTRSKNVATVRVAEEVGLGSAIHLAQTLGIENSIPDVPAVALGAVDVRPIELIAAYAAFANGGHRVEPHLVREILDRDGNPVWREEPIRQQVLDPAVAFVLTDILRDVVDEGTGAAVRAVGFGAPAAGKTGTTNDASDAWFIGYTPDLVAGVWIGLDRPATIVSGASGGTLAAPVWGRIMRGIHDGRNTRSEWAPPPGVASAQVDRLTGAVVTDTCPARGPVYTEYFIQSVPTAQPCPEVQSIDALGDSIWIDEEWRLDPDTQRLEDDDLRDGIDWPELEALRRRLRQAEEEARDEARDRDGGGREGEPGGDGQPPLLGEPADRDTSDPRSGSRGARNRDDPVSGSEDPPGLLGVPTPPREP